MRISCRTLGLAVLAWLAVVSSSVARAQESETPETDETVPAAETTAGAGDTALDGAAPVSAAPLDGAPAAEGGAPPPPADAGDGAPAVEGPLYVVTPDLPDTLTDADVPDIYRQSDQTFLTVLWWWVLLILGIAGLGAGAWFLWGRRRPRRPAP